MEEGEEVVWLQPPMEVDAGWWAGGGKTEDARPLKVQFSEPAKHFTDAAPIGNGRLGAMVWGGVASETLQLNHDTLWTGVPGNYTDPNAPAVLSKVRELVDNGQYSEASLAAFGLFGHPTEVYQPLGDINLNFGDSDDAYMAYERELDLTTATVSVKYTLGDVEFTREHFSSNPHQVLVTKISANKSGCLSFTVYLDSKLHHHSSANSANQIIMEGSCPGKRIPPTGNDSENPSGIKFSAILELQIGGDDSKVQVLNDRKLKVDGSDWAVLLLAASSSFEGPFTKPSDSKKDPTSACLNTLSSVRNLSYSQLLAYHLDDYQNLFNRVTLQLSKVSSDALGEKRLAFLNQIPIQNSPASDCGVSGLIKLNSSKIDSSAKLMDGTFKSTAERVKSFKDDEDPSLVELLFHYGRYLLISCSRPGTQVANLQGIWNKDIEPAWDASPHLNINLQMNYWPSLSCNLSECQEPLFDFIASLAINGSKTAKGFLENKAYPLLEGCASFLLDWLIEVHGGYLETNPSTSPEHSFIAPDGKTASISYSSTMDMAIIREVFSAVISSAEVLGRSDSDFIKQIKKALSRLPPTKIARDGSIMEWALDFEDPEVHHRHLSHLFGLFPGHTMTIEKTPDLCKAAVNSLYKRGDDGPGWSTTWKMALWAHLHNSEHAYKLVRQLINLVDPDHEIKFEGGLYGNLFTAHPPFQIDANFGFTAAIAEMLVQSTEHDLYLLPALPREKWAEGCVKGLKAWGSVTVNICWKKGELHEACFWTRNENCLKRLHYRGTVTTLTLSNGNIYRFNKHLKCKKACSSKEGTFL